MTRENKLALVIGFGLLLLAGILVSDHLSAQQRVDEDSLVATEPHVIPDASILQPKNIPSATIALEPAVAPAPVLAEAEPQPQPPKRREIVIGQAPGTRDRVTNAPSRIDKELKVHIVKKGETLSEVAERYLGSRGQWQELARINNITNPNRLTVGTRLVIATAPNTTKPRSISESKVPVAPKVAAARTATVGEGDTLSDIAKRELGNANRWHDLWSANKAILPDPDRVTPGMILQLPVVSSAR